MTGQVPETKFCKDCKHYRKVEYKYYNEPGYHHKVYYKCHISDTDLVNGRQWADCEDWRSPGSNYFSHPSFCGVDGKFWEPKQVPGGDLRKTFGLDKD